ncbi:ABC transporter ATP-binding protein [Microvirga brassicacearum]|uniref:ABC transporter ATP-binding protein n=1 Tax=Microvirga brassicacearum TaxID=2580413 RepID=A0A5N3PIZ9_9HYPH|nr:ABC transporter ATP-binding protein [Microvirga brassicacearum]KAB0269717.1 ABC transporter ATP-binding protein [Microvirga brassicacearum]
MSSIRLSNINLRFPLYRDSSRSLKRSLLEAGKAVSRSRTISTDGGHTVVNALNNVTCNIEHGERIGLIGTNGAGKSTLLRVLAGIYEPTSGDIKVEGRVNALLNIGLGSDPDATGYENILLRGLYMGLHPKEIEKLAPAIAEFSELGEFLHVPVRTYSAGMGMRLSFAIATATHPDILLMDEWIMAGDRRFLQKARERVDSFVSRSQILILASHSPQILAQWCTRLFWMDSGSIVMEGETDAVLKQYETGEPPASPSDTQQLTTLAS